MKKIFLLKGMMCTACAANIANTVSKIHGVESLNIDFIRNEMTVEMNKDLSKEIIKAVKKAGYEAVPYLEDYEKRKEDGLIKLLISSFLLLVLMYFSMGMMIKLPYPNYLINHPLILSIIELLLTLPILIMHFSYITGGIKHLFKFNPDMNSLVTIGVLSSIILGIISTFQLIMNGNDGSLTLYFDSASMIITFVSIGKFIEGRSKDKTKTSIEELEKLEPKEGNVLVQGEFIKKNISDIPLGSIIEVKPGEIIPLDGIIIKGKSNVDEASITGESIPQEKGLNDTVISSTMNGDGYLEIRTTSTDSTSTIRRIIELVDEASSSKAKVSKLVDKISRLFTPLVIGIALITFLINGLYTNEWMDAINQGITVLVVSCPCALGLATPIAILVGSTIAAKNGLIINSISSIENLSNIKNIVFDKTGTITNGNLEVTSSYFWNDEENVYDAILSLEEMSSHPLSKSLKNYALKNHGKRREVSNFISEEGFGVKGDISGNTYYIGSYKYLINHLNIDNDLNSKINQYINDGYTTVFIFSDRLIGMFLLKDNIREESKEAVQILKKKGYNIFLLTGDNEKVASNIGSLLMIDHIFPNVRPIDKKNMIDSIKKKGRTLMVGDGINDAIALEEADVGMSVITATDIAKTTADIILTHNGIFDVINAIRLSKRVMTTIVINLIWAFLYNLFAIIIATGIFNQYGLEINPMIASIMMSISSVFVVLNSLTIQSFKPIKYQPKEENTNE